MQTNQKLLPLLLLSVLFAAGCGGGGASDLSDSQTDVGDTGNTNDGDTGDGDTSDDDDDNTGGGSDGVSYLPLMVLEKYEDYSGFDQNDVFASDVDTPYIRGYLINPVDSATLQPITNVVASNYVVTVDGLEITQTESFPTLQQVVGAQVSLRTALVFDISGSMVDVDMQQLVNEAKDYVAAAQAHSNPGIANQEYTVWIFGDDPLELTSGFTSNSVAVEAALDQVVVEYASVGLGYGSSIHRAVIEAIGRYDEGDYHYGSDGDNDLVDYLYKDGLLLSQMVIFSSGDESALEFPESEMTRAIESQGFAQYTGVSTSVAEFTKKPVFYYVVGGASVGTAYAPLSALAETTRFLTLVSGEYIYASNLIQSQIDAIDSRVDQDNLWVYRFAFVPRVGDHTILFSSNSTTNSYGLSAFIDGDNLNPALGSPIEVLTNELIEIAGNSGEYISNDVVSFAEMQTFRAATRWTVESYGAADYSWAITNGTGTDNGDGTFTVTSVTAPATLTLTNVTIGGYQAQITITD